MPAEMLEHLSADEVEGLWLSLRGEVQGEVQREVHGGVQGEVHGELHRERAADGRTAEAEHADIPIAPVRTAPAPSAFSAEVASEIAHAEGAVTAVTMVSAVPGPDRAAIDQMEVRASVGWGGKGSVKGWCGAVVHSGSGRGNGMREEGRGRGKGVALRALRAFLVSCWPNTSEAPLDSHHPLPHVTTHPCHRRW